MNLYVRLPQIWYLANCVLIWTESRVRVSAENFSRTQSRFAAERNGDEELLQPNKRDESEGSSFASEADAIDRLREEGDQQGLGQLPRQVHPNELHRSPPPRLLWWNDLLLPRCAAGGAPPPGAPAACRPLISSLLRVGPSVQDWWVLSRSVQYY
ncbi:hypothetical protein MRB53_013144 [Persea americana]|uniref:Uncharacterized protein n=1 Tax=Persea americana TaxID=3435 RepID=A0ACC2K754_PERAE|nr:hypothetical protein MRB53_013144 [Persea americana]